MADESCDVSNTEQFALRVRFVDSRNLKICKQFLQFVPVTETLTNIILDTL